MSLTHTPLGLMDEKRSTRKKKKEAKQCTLITAALHFSAFYLSRGIDFMASITFNGVELWKEPWNDTEAAVRRNPKGFPLTFYSFLSLFSSIILFFPAHGGKMLILSEEYLEFCLPQWLCFATGAGYCPYIYMAFHCEFDLHGRSDFMLVCVCVCIL